MAGIYAKNYGNPFDNTDGVLAAALMLMPSVEHGCECPLYVTAKMKIQENKDNSCVVSLGNYSKTINLKASDLYGVWQRDMAEIGGNAHDGGGAKYWKAYRKDGRAYLVGGRNFPFFVVDDRHTSDGEKLFPVTVNGDKMTLSWQHNMGHYVHETWHREKGVVNKKDTIFDNSSDISYALKPRGGSYSHVLFDKKNKRKTGDSRVLHMRGRSRRKRVEHKDTALKQQEAEQEVHRGHQV